MEMYVFAMNAVAHARCNANPIGACCTFSRRIGVPNGHLNTGASNPRRPARAYTSVAEPSVIHAAVATSKDACTIDPPRFVAKTSDTVKYGAVSSLQMNPTKRPIADPDKQMVLHTRSVRAIFFFFFSFLFFFFLGGFAVFGVYTKKNNKNNKK
jgi:hypothetical protein